jgi:hypothetical protein
LDISQGDPTYTATMLSKEEIIDNHMSVLSSFGLAVLNEDYDPPLLYVLHTKITQVFTHTNLEHQSFVEIPVHQTGQTCCD